MACECAGYGRASVPPILATVGQGLLASPAGLDSRRGGRQPRGAAASDAGLLPVSVCRGDIAQQRAARRARLLSALQHLAQATRSRLTTLLTIGKFHSF